MMLAKIQYFNEALRIASNIRALENDHLFELDIPAVISQTQTGSDLIS